MGRLRIIAGRLKGRRVEVPSIPGLRPTADRVREALFDILGPRVAGARVLDAYCGSGALGLEALSRGAREVVFIEADRRAAQALGEVLAGFGVARQARVLCGPVAALLARDRGAPYDLIFADPPYEGDEVLRFLPLAAGRVGAEGLVIIERDAHSHPQEAAGLELLRSVRHGRARLDFYGPRRPAGVGSSPPPG
jgi:16S rRNA (guanine966-N2)-methyltransferase